jgi:hypothetical protein
MQAAQAGRGEHILLPLSFRFFPSPFLPYPLSLILYPFAFILLPFPQPSRICDAKNNFRSDEDRFSAGDSRGDNLGVGEGVQLYSPGNRLNPAFSLDREGKDKGKGIRDKG